MLTFIKVIFPNGNNADFNILATSLKSNISAWSCHV